MTPSLPHLFEQQMIESAITTVIFIVWKYARMLSSFLCYLPIEPRTFRNHFPFSGTRLFLLRISCSFASVARRQEASRAQRDSNPVHSLHHSTSS